jgi:hypothetical protein
VGWREGKALRSEEGKALEIYEQKKQTDYIVTVFNLISTLSFPMKGM